jgi:hypothetical protein
MKATLATEETLDYQPSTGDKQDSEGLPYVLHIPFTDCSDISPC